jgi:DNA-binding MarR family transcriptional regulator
VLTQLVNSGEPLALCDLATRLACVRSNVTQLVDRLEADGLVRRTDDPGDRRSVRAEITTRGRDRQAAGAKKVEAVQAEFESTLGTDRAALSRVLASFV